MFKELISNDLKYRLEKLKVYEKPDYDYFKEVLGYKEEKFRQLYKDMEESKG